MEKQEVHVYEPTEESFHDLSELGAEDILDLSSIHRDNVVSPTPGGHTNVTEHEPPMIISTCIHQHVQGPETPLSSTPTHKRLCPECGLHVLKRNFTRHYKGHFDINYKCTKCTRYFEDQPSLDAHNNLRHSENHICAFCGKCYIRKSALNEHTRIKHEGSAKMTACTVCNKQFHRVGHLQDHMNTHYKRAIHKCQRCKRQYHSLNSLRRHTNDCTGTGKTCNICKRTFSSGNTLYDHQKSEHGGKVYACECGNTYKWRIGLSRHRKSSNHTN